MIAIARGDSQAGVPPVDAGESMAAAMRIAALRHRPEEAGSLANIGFGGPHKQQKLRAAANSLEEALWRPKGERARMEQDEDNPDGIPDVLKLEQPFTASTQSGRVCDEIGVEVAWPWEHRPEARQADRARVAQLSAERQRMMLAHDHLLERAMLLSSADGAMGENTTGVRAWKEFCAKIGISYLRPLDPNASLADKLEEEQLAMRFVCSLVQERGIQVDTAANYLGQVQGFAARRCGVKLAGGLKLARLPAMLKGLKRIVGDKPRAERRGIAAHLLRKAMDKVLDPEIPSHANLRALLSVAFQGLLRSAEFCDDGKKTTMRKILENLPTRSDLVYLDRLKAVVMMRPCKNMRHLKGKTVPLVLGAGGEYIDAVAELNNLMRVDPAELGREDTPLFRNPKGSPFTYDQINRLVKMLMREVGEDEHAFSTHSLRIGGATALFAAGASPTVIRTMGRWSSDCYRLYVRASYESTLYWTKMCGSTKVSDIAADFDEVDSY
jgi:hypothetical protein